MTNQKSHKGPPDNPGVRIPPPLIVLVFLFAGLSIDGFLSHSFGLSTKGVVASGIGFCFAGAGLLLWSALTFRSYKTSILPHTPDTSMMDSGPYAFSRNPIYIAMFLIFTGICFIFDSLMALVFLIPVILIIRFYVIAREEAYLERRFGEAYLEYKTRVRRWI